MNQKNDQFFQKNFTYVSIEQSTRLLKKEDKNLFLGSCFAENLYSYYRNNNINSFFSPFGNIYNPLSLASSLKLLCSHDTISEKSIFKHKGLWRHFAFDSSLCKTEKLNFLNSIRASLKYGQDYLKSTDNLILTLGTSYVYKDVNNGIIVNNCHKLPAERFLRENIPIDVMKKALIDSINFVKAINKNINVIVTLSPVRHLRDNPVGNSLSKARLRCLIEELSRETDLWYFPAYEIVLDQLRDYRWYGDDMAHPSDKAVEYIMERFIGSAADSEFQNYLDDMIKLNNSLNHRVQHEDTEETRSFLQFRKKYFQSLIKKYPSMTELQSKYDSHFSGKQ